MYFPSFEKFGQPMLPRASSLHFFVSKSNSISARESPVNAPMYRPFGDHTGENKPCDPGTTETCRVTRSRIRICDVTSWALPPKRTWLPSGDQLGSPVQ